MTQLNDDRSRGQALVEFAAVIPLILLLMLALFDAGRAVIFYTELTNATRVGARVAMVNQSHDASCTTSDRTYKCAASELTTSMGIPASSIPAAVFEDKDGNSVVPDAGACQTYGACSATVSATSAFTPITPIIGNIIGNIKLSASPPMAIARTSAGVDVRARSRADGLSMPRSARRETRPPSWSMVTSTGRGPDRAIERNRPP